MTGEPDSGAKWRVRASFITVVVVAFVVTAVMGYAIRENRKLAQEGAAAHRALCADKLGLERRIISNEKFLTRPPKTVFGIVVNKPVIASVKNDLANRQSALTAYSGLRCKEDPVMRQKLNDAKVKWNAARGST